MPFARTLALLLLLASPTSAAKRDAEEQQREGERLLAARRYPAAIRAFQRALADGGDRVILFHLARAQEADGRLDQALASCRAFLRAAPMSPLRFDVRDRIRRLQGKLRVRAPRAEPGTAASGGDGERAPAPGSTTTPAMAEPGVLPTDTARPAQPAPAVAEGHAPLPPAIATEAEAAARVVVAPAPASGVDGYQAGAAGSVLGGAVLLGGGVGCIAVSAMREDELERAVRYDPALDASGYRFQIAGAVLSAAGVAAILIGAELIRRHSQRLGRARAASSGSGGERAGAANARAPAPARLGLAF